MGVRKLGIRGSVQLTAFSEKDKTFELKWRALVPDYRLYRSMEALLYLPLSNGAWGHVELSEDIHSEVQKKTKNGPRLWMATKNGIEPGPRALVAWTPRCRAPEPFFYSEGPRWSKYPITRYLGLW